MTTTTDNAPKHGIEFGTVSDLRTLIGLTITIRLLMSSGGRDVVYEYTGRLASTAEKYLPDAGDIMRSSLGLGGLSIALDWDTARVFIDGVPISASTLTAAYFEES